MIFFTLVHFNFTSTTAFLRLKRIGEEQKDNASNENNRKEEVDQVLVIDQQW